MTELTLAEEFLILAIDEKPKRIYEHIVNSFNGAILMDLKLRRKFILEGKKHILKVVDSSPTGNPILDRILTTISSIEGKKLYYWIKSGIRKSTPRELFYSRYSHLESLNIIKITKQKFHRHYLLKDTKIKSKLIDRIQDTLVYKKKPSERTKYLLSLLKNVYAYSFGVKPHIPKEHWFEAKKYLKTIVADEIIGKKIKKYLSYIEN